MQLSLRLLATATLAVACLLLSACGGSDTKRVYPVRGQVFADKKPAEKAVVVLHPLQDADPAKWPHGFPRGTVSEDGSFRITTYEADDGAPAGDYAVTIQWMVENPDEVDLLGGRYADPKRPQFRIKVEEKDNVLDPFNVK